MQIEKYNVYVNRRGGAQMQNQLHFWGIKFPAYGKKISFIFDFEITLCECWSEVKKGEIKNFGNFISKVHQSNQKLEAKRVARFAFMLKSEKSAI